MLRADGGTEWAEATRVIRGAATIAGQALAFSQPGLLVRPALVNGAPGVVNFVDGRPFSVLGFTVVGGRIVEIDILADPARLRELDLSVFDS